MAEKSEWTDELKAEVVEAYLSRNPTPENTMDIVKELAEEFEKSPNGIRMILTRADAYVKKVPAKTESKAGAKTEGAKRVNKAEAIATLRATIVSKNLEPDDDILDRLTGKAAVYFTNLFNS